MRNRPSPGYSAEGAEEALALRHGAPDDVRRQLVAARERTLRLAQDFFRALGPAARLPYADELNPPLWELGHIGWFQEWWIARNPERALGAKANPAVPRGLSLLPQADGWYNSSTVEHRSRWELPLPPWEATEDYLSRTLAGTLQLLDALPPAPGDDALYFFRLVAMHEQMHAEAAVYMAQALGIPLRDEEEPPRVEAQGEVLIGDSLLTLGAAPPGFAFDNELGPHAVELQAFCIDAAPVTWEEFLPFVEDGGYEDGAWWTPEGREWLAHLRHRSPAGLRRTGSGWERLRHGRWHTLQEREAAVHLNAWEAEAWCRWAGRRLPTEAEWECAALTGPDFRWGQVWEWTASAFAPFPGFAPHPYRDYSQPWFGSRRVLRGASTATAPALVHARYRNFYEPQRRDIFAGFRSVRTGDKPKGSGV